MQVREILAIKGTVLYTTTPTALLTEAAAVMAENDMGSLVVMEGGDVAGMLTFREVIKAASSHEGTLSGMKVGEVMVRDPVSTTPEVEMDDLRRVMLDCHMRYLPVMDGKTLLGVISFHDVAKAVLEEQSFENKMLKNYIRNWPSEE